MDYIGLSVILNFATCETRHCVNVSIVEDFVDEPEEEFGVILERTVGLNNRITLDPVDGNIFIMDNDGI